MEFLTSLQAQQEQIQKQKALQEKLMEQDKSTPGDGFFCSICGTEFARKHHLKRHMMLHTSIKPYVCMAARCKKSFARKDYLDMHEKTCPHLYEESNSGLKALNGSKKGSKRSNSKVSKGKARNKNLVNGSLSSLVAYAGPGAKKSTASSRRRNKGDVFACPTCRAQDGNGPLTFTTKGALTRHNNEKHAQKHYECDICRKSFARKYRLKTHYMSYHSIHLSASDLKLKAVSNTSYGRPQQPAPIFSATISKPKPQIDPIVSSDSTASMLQRAYKATPTNTLFKKRKALNVDYNQQAKRVKKVEEIDDVQAAWDLLGMMHCM